MADSPAVGRYFWASPDDRGSQPDSSDLYRNDVGFDRCDFRHGDFQSLSPILAEKPGYTSGSTGSHPRVSHGHGYAFLDRAPLRDGRRQQPLFLVLLCQPEPLCFPVEPKLGLAFERPFNPVFHVVVV